MDLLEKFMLQSVEIARAALVNNEVPIGALLLQGGEIIGYGCNERERSARTLAHAELNALENYNRRFHEWRVPPESSLFVTVEPCLMCVGALLWARVDHIYYGCEDPKNAGLRSVLSLIDNGRFEHKFKIIQGGILAEICSDLIRDFFHKIRLTDLNVPSSG